MEKVDYFGAATAKNIYRIGCWVQKTFLFQPELFLKNSLGNHSLECHSLAQFANEFFFQRSLFYL